MLIMAPQANAAMTARLIQLAAEVPRQRIGLAAAMIGKVHNLLQAGEIGRLAFEHALVEFRCQLLRVYCWFEAAVTQAHS
jgi:hypothetical protein